MATINSLGVGSGLDLGGLVANMLAAERAPTENRLAFKSQNLTTQLSGFGLLKSSLASFQNSLAGLKSSTAFDAKQATTSDSSVFTISADNDANVGSYSIEVTAVAQKQSLATNAATAFADVSDTIGSGTLTIQFGTTSTGPYSFTQDTTQATQTITVSAANNNTTLSGMRDYLNDNDFGVQASIVNDGNGYRLLLTSESTGAKNSMSISVTSDGDGNDNDNTGLSQLAFNALAQTSVTQTVAAQDAALSINGLDITRESNTVTGAINGVTLNLLKADAGNTVAVGVTESRGNIKSSIQGFVSGYNELVENVNKLTAFNAETGTSGILNGDFTVRNISGQIRSVLQGFVSELSGNIRSLVDIGIKTSSGGTLTIDSSKLDDALANYPSEVEALFSLQGRPDDADVQYASASSDTAAGNYAVSLSALSTQSQLNGSVVNSLIIDANNDNFTIKVDGVTSNSVNLTQATYADGDALAAHIQAQINGDDQLKAEGATVSVVYDSINNKFDITSARYGSASKIEFTAVDLNSSNDIGFSVGSGTDGTDITGAINGVSATGNGQLLTSQTGNSKGLALNILAGAAGSRGDVSFSRGIASTLDTLLTDFLGSDGFIANREDGLKEGLEDVGRQRELLETRLETMEARFVKQFTALDILIARFNSTSNFLTQQLANLPKPNSVGN